MFYTLFPNPSRLSTYIYPLLSLEGGLLALFEHKRKATEGESKEVKTKRDNASRRRDNFQFGFNSNSYSSFFHMQNYGFCLFSF